MNIRHFLLYGTLDPKYGGPTYSVPAQVIGLQKEGVEMSLVVFESSKPWEDRLITKGVKMVNLPDPKNKFEHSWAIQLKKYFSICNDFPDIIHTHGVWMPEEHYCACFALKYNIPYIINPRGDLDIYRLNYSKWKKLKKKIAWALYAKKDVARAACIIATSKQEMESVRSIGVKNPIAIIPNGIDMEAFPKQVSHNHGEKKILLFLSRVNPIKGLEYLLDAWSKLEENIRDNWELHIVGNSDPDNYQLTLENKVRNLGIIETVKFLGPINGEEKMRKYQDSDLFILPTLNENFGNVIAEAMMCECPVITTKNAPWDGLLEEKCGWWIDLSVDNLVKTLIESMSLSDEERYKLGAKSREYIINHFSLEIVSKQTIQVYEWILGKAKKPQFVYIN